MVSPRKSDGTLKSPQEVYAEMLRAMTVSK
jgi:hypothetical protein